MENTRETIVKYDHTDASATVWPSTVYADMHRIWPSTRPTQHLLLSWGHMVAGLMLSELEDYDTRVLIDVQCADSATAIRFRFRRIGIDAPGVGALFDRLADAIDNAFDMATPATVDV